MAAKDETVRYLPPAPIGMVRVKLTGPEEDRQGIYSMVRGEWDGAPIAVHFSGLDLIRVRRAIEAHGAVLTDVYAGSVRAVAPDVVAELRDAVLAGRAGGAMDGEE